MTHHTSGHGAGEDPGEKRLAGRAPPPDPSSARNLPRDDPPLDELEKARDFDRDEHVRRGMAAGLTREEAERHADEDLASREIEEGRR